MQKKALLILAEGFEEVEATTPIDILRRSGVTVTVAGLNGKTIKGSHGITLEADIKLDDANDSYDAIILPGGMPGAENLARSEKVKTLITSMNKSKKIVAAICASPALVLGPMGILDGKEATCYPTMETNFSSRVKFSKEKVIQDGNVITSRGPATAIAFSLKIAESLTSKETSKTVGSAFLYT